MAAPTVVTKYGAVNPNNPVDAPLQTIEFAIGELANLVSKAGGYGILTSAIIPPHGIFVVGQSPLFLFTNDTVFSAAVLAAVQNRIPDAVTNGVSSSGNVQP